MTADKYSTYKNTKNKFMFFFSIGFEILVLIKNLHSVPVTSQGDLKKIKLATFTLILCRFKKICIIETSR